MVRFSGGAGAGVYGITQHSNKFSRREKLLLFVHKPKLCGRHSRLCSRPLCFQALPIELTTPTSPLGAVLCAVKRILCLFLNTPRFVVCQRSKHVRVPDFDQQQLSLFAHHGFASYILCGPSITWLGLISHWRNLSDIITTPVLYALSYDLVRFLPDYRGYL